MHASFYLHNIVIVQHLQPVYAFIGLHFCILLPSTLLPAKGKKHGNTFSHQGRGEGSSMGYGHLLKIVCRYGVQGPRMCAGEFDLF